MKKWLAVLTALVLSLAGLLPVAVLGEEVTAFSSETYDISLNLNDEILPSLLGASDEDSVNRIGIISKIVNGLGINVVSDGVDSELTLSLNDQPMALFAFLKDENCIKILSDLLPNSILSVSAEDIGGAMPQVSLDPEAMAQIIAEPVEKLSAELNAKIGDPEAVEETFYDVVFTTKIPVNITAKELSLLLLNTAKEITSAEGFAQVMESLKQYNINFDAATIDNAIEQVTNTSDEDQPVLDAAMFSNDAGDYLTQFLLTKDEQSMSIHTGTIQNVTIVDADILSQLKLLIKADSTGNTDLSLDFAPQEGMLISIVGNVAAAESVLNAVFTVKLNAMDIVTLSVSKTDGGSLSGALPVEGKTEYSFKDLQDPESEGYAALMQELQTSVIQLLGKAVQVVPEIATLMQPAQTAEPVAEPVAP